MRAVVATRLPSVQFREIETRRWLVYPAASNDDVAVVEDDRLAGSNCRLRRIECELGAAVLERADASR